MTTVLPDDTLHVMNWRISELAHLLGAMRLGVVQGGNFLQNRIAPNGPILAEPNLLRTEK